jgi:voltage-gated potassium channel
MNTQDKRLKYFPQRPLHLLQRITSRRNAMLLVRLFAALALIIFLYSLAFQYIMHMESREYSFIAGLYWVVSTMSTLGQGDITFSGDTGMLFTILVLGTGVVFLLAILPFTLIRLFQSSARVPRELPENTKGHVVIIEFGELTSALIERLKRYNQSYAVLVADVEEAVRLQDQKIKVVAGVLDDPNTFKELRIPQATFVVATGSDITNTTLAYNIRQISKDIPIIASASGEPAVSILENAGCSHVLALDEMMGQSLSRRIIAGDAMAHVIGQVDELIIAEAAAAGTPLVGKTIEQVRALHLVDASIVGVWDGGVFMLPDKRMTITKKNILVLAGKQNQIDLYNELFCIYNINSAPIIIIGAGSVGRALGRALKEHEIDYRIIEKNKKLIPEDKHYIIGDATDAQLLKSAGFFETPAIAITSHSDPINIYLTTYCRHLRKDIQIISRATLDRSIRTLHSAGCDFVVSHASLGANNILNLSKRGNILMVAEGVDVFRVKTPKKLLGKTIKSASIREFCGCHIVGIISCGSLMIDPQSETILPSDGEMILVGTVESEEKFFKQYQPEK